MTFLDSSVIIDMLAGVNAVVEAVEARGQPYLTSAICVFEVLDGAVGGSETDIVRVREQFGGVRALDLNESIAIEAAQMQDRLMDDGERMPARDLFIAATARSTGDEFVVADGDFETGLLSETMDVTNLRRND